MNLAALLDSEGIKYKLSTHPPTYTSQGLARSEHISGYQVAKPVVVHTDFGFAMCVIPACKHLDLHRVAEVLQVFDVRLASEFEMVRLFPHCELGAEPPIGTMFDLKTVIDSSLHGQDYIVMQAGSHDEAVEIRRDDWERLCDPIVADIVCG